MTPSLNPSQEKAAKSSKNGHILIVAGAGTGKTRTLTSRAAYLIESGVPPEKICAITFTNKAAKEMRSRIWRLLGAKRRGGGGFVPPGTPGTPFIGTFHSLGATLLRSHMPRLGRNASFSILDENDSFSLIKKLVKSAEESAPASDIRNWISERKNGREKNPAKGPAKDRGFEEIFQRYEGSLAEWNAFDFDDLIEKAVGEMERDEKLRTACQSLFSHILIDEYQDINPSQHALVRLLAGDEVRVSAVGDAEQTIYSWRGSDIGIFLDFPKHWENAEVVPLEESYRSTKCILRAASALISQNVYDAGVARAIRLWTENPEGEKISLFEAPDEMSEAIWIADRIAEIRSGRNDASVAVLYRTNAQSRAIEGALIASRIPYRIFGGIKFYERREIKDIIAAIRFALNPEDLLSRERLEKTVGKRGFSGVSSVIRGKRDEHPVSIIKAFLDASDYPALIRRTMTNPRDREENIEELVRFAMDFENAPSFLERVSLLDPADEIHDSKFKNHESRNPATLMTMHMAKGLEFDYVFVAGCAEGLTPHALSYKTPEQLQEERRLFYVAMTRARQKLSLSFSGIPSRFLSELPGDCTELASPLSDGGATIDYEERYITLD